MARVAPLNPPYTPDIQAAFDAIMPAGVDPLVLFRTLAVNARVIERAAAQLAGSFDLDVMVNAIAAFAGPDLSAIQEKLAKAQNRAADAFASLYLPQLPTRHEIVRRARAMFARHASIDVIVSRAHAVILDTIGARLSAMPAAH
jgi:hypothetical protein